MSGPGRRPGPSATRARIVAAARELFAEKGFDATSLRAVARAAEVDPALVHHYFTGKAALFVAAMEFPFDPSEVLPLVLEGPREELGERLVRTFLGLWGDPELGPRLLAVVRTAVAGEGGAALVREFVSAALLNRIADALDVPRLRVAAVASQMVGFVIAQRVLELPAVVAASDDEIVALLAPTVQRYLG
ncbi:TetR family transcriptional regulator [Actinocorallia sp. API 0066]|uniref:TetR/AcrR family transcriptional regulator n=1 Tax=Actinocorallia sp. API 0066 TaxID=2896846 RepID=UPI0027E02255|nr:TetR family transcriptional regulator [Actinocorallia sp. API 0066]